MTSLTLRTGPQSPNRTTSSYSGFALPSSPSSGAPSDADGNDDDGDDTPLPFPTALSRRDFLAPDFRAAEFLSSLFPSGSDTTAAHRHQTLEDLRAELRDRGAAIGAELLELVNANYTSFLGLGDELKGGEDRVEDVRVALLGFRRGVEDVQARVRARRVEVAEACRELAGVRAAVELGRRMLELDERVGLLEGRLALASLPSNKEVNKKGGEDGGSGVNGGFDVEESDDDDEEDEEGQDMPDGVNGHKMFVASSPTKLLDLAKDLMLAEQLVDSIGRDVPFVKKMQERLIRCRNTILLDLKTAVKEAKSAAGTAGQTRTLKLLAIYRLINAEAEAVQVLREK
ncbi:uncharacterized protein E0L32_008913 [Thyridium curvatum]|uniref:Conserved oligomeric Golgi complex subunit 2 n=1 Tax=Thyridium curvatum TaxID=1093900 RepID=A0A507AYF4_9PEZI|nr:uncharacterized protein E0L32_008913 [Thyridium curvatum]TPX09891.1 hypothetical protein E0L32_008913 [Thyridium curvatum]